MATAKMKIILPLVVWLWLNTTAGGSYSGIGFGIKREVFFLNLEDGYFGCQVNESTDVLQLFELSRLCDGTPNCFLGSDELRNELKCTDDCRKEDGTLCQNGACLDNNCHCNDGYGGCSCEVPDENECKYRPCDVFAHCTNTLGSFQCTCFPGYRGDGFHCEDINECDDKAIASRCVANAECCNVPGHFVCKCLPGYHGDGEIACIDIDECTKPGTCGRNALCQNSHGNYSCICPEGYFGNPYDGCVDVDECEHEDACGPGAICTNLDGTKQCTCPPGYGGDAYTFGCDDIDECAQHPCGKNAKCTNLEGTFSCTCPSGYVGNPLISCTDVTCRAHTDCPLQQACIVGKCQNPCSVSNPCSINQDCQVQEHQPVCVKVCQCQTNADCGGFLLECDGCYCVIPRKKPDPVLPGCEHCPPGVLCDPRTGACIKVSCITNNDCPLTEACINRACQRPCDIHNPCTKHAVCINTNHGTDCSCMEGYQGNGYVGCTPVHDHKPVCQYNEDCPPDKLCDRLNRICINPCFEDSCGENAICIPKEHAITCECLPGTVGNAFTYCEKVQGCRSDSECAATEACINGQCGSPCQCGINAICEVLYHRATCKCPPGYTGNSASGCRAPSNPCEPNPCGQHALCELDNGNPICFCPKGLTGNPFKMCVPDGGKCDPNPCGSNSGCRLVGNKAVCFCLPEYEGSPPHVPCTLPIHPCNPSPCGPNTQCTVLSNGFAKCTCLPGFLESPNTVRGCVEQRNLCEPNPCGHRAICDPLRDPVCTCPLGTRGNPYRTCLEIVPTTILCQPGPCGINADCYVSNNQERCYCKSGFIGDPYTGCRSEPRNPCLPNPCGPGAECIITSDRQSMCRCPAGVAGDPTGSRGCHGYECVVDDDCSNHQACMGHRCRDPCPGSCGINANCKVEGHHPVCSCNHGLTGNPLVRCHPVPTYLPPDPCTPSPCGANTACQVLGGRPVCTCLPDFQGDPQFGCHPECTLNSDCPSDKACLDRHCKNPCLIGAVCGLYAKCQVRDHTATCVCPDGYMGDAFFQCVPRPTPGYNVTIPCTPSPCGPNTHCDVFGTQIAVCNPCLGPNAALYPHCRPECLTDVDCPFNKACLGQSCVDPCPGSCGVNADCTVVMHSPVCTCRQGLYGNPFEHCTTAAIVPEDKSDTCDSTTCGANAYCQQKHNALACICKPGFFGNPYISCRPECVVNTHCPIKKACVNQKCINPCAGACGLNAHCNVINHEPVCYCPAEYIGDPFVSCTPYRPMPHPTNPCDPSPCGPFSRCLVSPQGYATCSCLPTYKGTPPACQPECIVSSECSQMQACVNQKCIDPCPGTCGINAICTVINHNPICSCPQHLRGDPFVNCYPEIITEPKTPEKPCEPSPCGSNSICQVRQGRPVCSCDVNYIGTPPYCRPECVMNSECPGNKACVEEKCINPCPKSCGYNAKCNVVNHTPFCYCLDGYEGDAFVGCSQVIRRPEDPCNPSPCGENAQCSVHNGVPRCNCIPPYIGNPYAGGCRPECTINAECPSHLACLNQHCRDPCQGLCGINAECHVVNHIPTCACFQEYVGDPFTACRQKPIKPPPPQNPCEPSPCGQNSICRVSNGHAVCSCQTGYFGAPPGCRPECLVSSDCSQNKACINKKCQDPCPGSCGFGGLCQTVYHNPICSCPPDYTGDPFVQCTKEPKTPLAPMNPCIPSPCGPNAECRIYEQRALCTCLSGMLGAPPHCRHECVIDSDCPLHLSCLSNKCKDPCVGSCGFNSLCSVLNHRPICTCLAKYEGDPFTGCQPKQIKEVPQNPCNPSPCGTNTICKEHHGAGSCTCMQDYYGDPYVGCRPECLMNNDCSSDKACFLNKCKNPCAGACGTNAECHVVNHRPTCSCIVGYTGNALSSCRPIELIGDNRKNLCVPSPCGAYSTCRVVHDSPVCACLLGYIGTPPNCKPECIVNSECSLNLACSNQRCTDPCVRTCGYNALCKVINHSPVCSCPDGFMGDPFQSCTQQPIVIEEPKHPCTPSPCGQFSDCRVLQNTAVCSCLPNYYGRAPNCRPECTVNSECALDRICQNQKCTDPCHGSCGPNTECKVINHTPICYCLSEYSGDPFSGCSKFVPPKELSHPCNPSPCGSNAICRERSGAGSCTCLPEYFGDPYIGCRPECVVNTDCPKDKTCVNQKCRDPCPGTCGINAGCRVNNHAPSCYCLPGFTGNPLRSCHLPQPTLPDLSKQNLCSPSPCGLYSNCRVANGHAVCSCQKDYIGTPPSCRPECMVSADCAQDKACINTKCQDPCPGTCGLNARCQILNHNPICSCPPQYTGDPFVRCIVEPKKPIVPNENPCIPSPCGLNSQCRVVGNQAACTCLPNYIGRAPNCRPECAISADCAGNLACVNERCVDPCPGSCGANANCIIVKHSPICQCETGYTGDPFNGCSFIEIQPTKEYTTPCNPSPCGANAVCKERNGAGSCSCLSEYFGDPYTGCKPECVINTDCSRDKACINNKCKDPCAGACGINAECSVNNHAPSCYCNERHTGNPLVACHKQAPPPAVEKPCEPSPCGPYSQCRVVNGHAVCSCQANYIGTPPACRPECMISADCSQTKACINTKCQDPCPGSCGLNARCQVVNHNPICTCPPEFTGDAFVRCIPEIKKPDIRPSTNPCVPSPCGPNSQCRIVGSTPACSCLPNYVGRSPNCRPECTINAECSPNRACQNEKCIDPCPGSCGANANCVVINHRSVCSCSSGYTGDPFAGCSVIIITQPKQPQNPCNPSPCGANAICKERNGVGSCTCIPEYFGDPYTGCRPECVTNSDCARDKACVNNKCKDPCPGTCGINAECYVNNHAPSCSCISGYTGNPLTSCHLPQPTVHEEPCRPSPCGPYSQCRAVNGLAVCSCQTDYVGTPPACRPQCMISADCPQDKACIKTKCQDPCPGTCGLNTRCQVVNHNPICTCSPGFSGDPFVRCTPEAKKPIDTGNPCVPSPCGPNSQCKVIGGQAACSCLPNYIGRAPNCRPECTINAECAGNLACQNEKCRDPCPGSCGSFTTCVVVKHAPVCQCISGYTGDPFTLCSPIPPIPTTEEPRTPCNPSPCGANAVCKEQRGAGSCTCLSGYFGDPYTGCRPECVINTDCDKTKACVNNKCVDPCPGTCGINAQCQVFNHAPSCLCIEDYTGDPTRSCQPVEKIVHPKNPCEPSPCGPYSQCRVINDHAVCSCNVGYIGTPPTCRPECVVSSECPQNKACVDQKCTDPCPGTCGYNAKCQVVNHNPICTCMPGHSGDPFVSCHKIEIVTPPPKAENPCDPSPCGPNSQCKVVGSSAACSCLPNYIGRSPNCRPECTLNSECPNNLACVNEKCVDPCTDSCGINAQCTVVNHNPVCSCLPGYIGDAFSSCNLAPPSSTERTPPTSPCFPSPCGPNAECRERNNAGSCICAVGYEGNPYDQEKGCRRECETNRDCAPALSCVLFKCVDPCPGTCGIQAQCHVENHIPTCTCLSGFTGDPFFQCREVPVTPPPQLNPCQPSPCGPNSQCRKINDQAVCSCLPNYIGTPPQCRPECVVNLECPPDKACVNQKCSDPCPNTCGIGAQCTTKNHNPICACPSKFTGDPFTNCYPLPIEPVYPTERPPSCYPSPCGPNSQCQMHGNVPSCSCLPNYIGSPPSCRPECVLNTECSSELACINKKCQNPCIGSCGSNAKCHVLNHLPICTCEEAHTGDPFTQCSLIVITEPKVPQDPCNPSPCGSNAECLPGGTCRCLSEYQGNPYESCRPECVVGNECSRDKACIRNKCIDPCPGTCGTGATCDTVNHIPVCSCPVGFTGDPFAYCRKAILIPDSKRDPCNPSPCGPNSQCRNINDHSVCSCIQGFMGTPPNCKPECIVSAECSPTRACVNQKCTDPCLGSCGIGARCEVINHSPICSCYEGQTGDPFTSCRELPKTPYPPEKINPCLPSPCGPNSLCKAVGETPSCQCIEGYTGNPPNCRPECVINPDCPSTQACINNKCRDPCPGSCGENAECRVISHMVTCSCADGYTGNPFVQCIVKKVEVQNPCEPSPCGPNAECKQRNGAGACSCIDDYQGNPYEGCRPECVLSSDCPTNKACIRNKCQDPCPSVCGENAECSVINHVPTCSCINGYIGDPFAGCRLEPIPIYPTVRPLENPCQPSPCGIYGRCQNVNEQAVCSCLPEYTGLPPNCKPECTVSSECPQNKACYKFKCTNPCSGSCGINARCEVINHNPICSCPEGLSGDPFTRCYKATPPLPPKHVDPCVPSPCGLNSICKVINEQASCSCSENYMGIPPNCRPECIVNTDCPSNLACITEKCRDPCPGSCGFNAECRVQNHIPICTCITGYIGDPFTQCSLKPEQPKVPEPRPCSPSPCGPNAECHGNDICTCLPEYHGDPYRGCRPECTMNTDCQPNKSCSNHKCIDPCPGTCGQNAQCDVVNHIPTCSCITGYQGDPFTICRHIPTRPEKQAQPCNPSPCGPNSLCKVVNEVAVCSCQPGYISSPPTCRPECIVSAECSLTQACLNNKCQDPCLGTCGINAKCQVINHNPICSCDSGYSGDPFTRCLQEPKEKPVHVNPCVPSPCGPNSHCQVRGESPACSCLPNYMGTPPNCRPECTINPECPSQFACINQQCRDPCPGSCGANAMCTVINHSPVCSCLTGYSGDPFTSCFITPAPPITPPKPINPCQPSPCGANTLCRIENNYALCECLPDYHGNPHEGCRPECLANSDCPMSLACIRNKCQDPCPGTCGVGAVCSVGNHIPICSCPDGFAGDAFRYCSYVAPEDKKPRNPCNPSPCGLNTICRVVNDNAVCECVPGFEGAPTAGGCRPECTISADCPRNKACINSKCLDPCIGGVCGYGSECHTINHSPVCTCPAPLIGDPFTLCKEALPEPRDPCNPSPCNVNGQCRVINKAAVCIYPECIINQDCPRDKVCYSQKCHDPCADSCGVNALCQVVNHKTICSCPAGYIGYPEVSCTFQHKEEPKPECTQDSECTNDKACINQHCRDPCTESYSVCGQNAECRVQLHRAICICREGFSGNAQSACFEIGCRSDNECPWNQACVNHECLDPCSYTQCGLNAICRSDSNHRARCYCPDRFKGDPYERCERPECVTDDECPFNLACQNERCEDPCNCGTGALCSVEYHKARCSCPPGYIGNPLTLCKLDEPNLAQCRVDADCPSKLACFSGSCQNPCLVTKPCGINAECSVVDTLPLRTMSCLCFPGYVGDADVECKIGKPDEAECRTNEDCASSEACIHRQCVNPCSIGNLCSKTAECHAANHKAVCRCHVGLIGDPFVSCHERTPGPTPSPECRTNSDCSSDKSCTNQRCENPCAFSNCGYQAECRTVQHIPICLCPDGWGGNPQQQCYKPQCKINDDCPYDKQCINDNCINPCASHSCGRSAECVVLNHQAKCQCPGGTQGNPLISCIAGICQYNEDCADDEACDRLNRVCRPACNEDTCADTATCVGKNHQPICTCPPGTTGNPYIDCSLNVIKPTCQSDSDCPSQYGCINSNCQNPCAITNICNLDQECRVLDTLPLRTVMCQCPPDTIADSTGHCRAVGPGPEPPQCHIDSDCSDSDKCIRGRCIEACKVDSCGYNAQCNSIHHHAVCSCSPGYIGNPHVECSKVHIYPIPIPTPECYSNDECPYDKRCKNDVCVNPCIEDKPCGIDSFCSVNKHQPICTCPSGYEGNPKVECIPPLGPGIGCKSNSECAGSEACVNGRCVSPCNCGPNAECKVTNHYPICYCNSGYSGNPQVGCVKLGCQSDDQCANDLQCYNGQCINPCVLGDPCSTTAQCYGNNHRATCKCPPGYDGNPLDRCERVECLTDLECPNNRACIEERCIDPCSNIANPPCAQNALCFVQNHAATCVCPPHRPEGNPLSYCSPHEGGRFECERDVDCPSKLACIENTCVNPCSTLSPCHRTAHCSVIDTVPVRTMVCTCPDGWVPNENGECHAIIVPVPPGCSSNDDCPNTEACINRLCRNPCNCGTYSTCLVQNHRPICSCEDGYEGNPNIACRKVGCRSNSECESGKSCINGNCVNPCLVRDLCGINAECYVRAGQAECRCINGYRGNPLERCLIVGCRTNSDCPGERQCVNAQCINPCVYDNPCSPLAECKVQNHMALCRCKPGYIGNPFIQCRPEIQPECRKDPDCPTRLACINNKCEDPCSVFEPCKRPAQCDVVGSVPVRTMICICPPGYISSGSGTCEPTKPIKEIGDCSSDNDCPADKACFNGICRNPCNCGPNADCQIKNHKPVCICNQGYGGNPEIECTPIGCRSNDDCSTQHSCINRHCVPVCAANGTNCGTDAICYGTNHRAVCECQPGSIGDPKVACAVIGCTSNSECPSNRACINRKCQNPCIEKPCTAGSECKVYHHEVECACPPGTITTKDGCRKIEEKCRFDSDCPSQTACINGKCQNPCLSIQPCGINADCKVLDTLPVRTMICECLPGYQGNAAVRCDTVPICDLDKGYRITPDGKCECPPNTALNENDECVFCLTEKGYKINERGRCVCALERGMIVDERGNCICPVEYGYRLDINGNCKAVPVAECENDYDCADHLYCNLLTKTCDNGCLTKHCGKFAFCNAVDHKAVCHCQAGYSGNAEIECTPSILHHRTDFPKPDMEVSCLSDGVQVQIHITDEGFNGVLYVKGHSKDEQCRRVITVPSNERSRTEIFKVHFGNCGLIHVNGQASFVLVIQKHPKLVTYKAQAYHIKCIYQTGEQNVTLGFNVSMLTTAGTIANTGPPPTCVMKIVTHTGQEVNSAEIGDNLMLQVEVQPGSIYGGFARSCIAKTIGDNVENEYTVTDENGCATDPTIFGEWEYNADTQSLLATFNAFKFPSSDNIRFQCNIRVCFGRCQPVNCRGYNAFGRRKRAIDSENTTDVLVPGDLMSGQLREEITIQSNAILTFERREERFVDPTEAPNAQRVEDICVSMIGFIISLVITALLALVAVAVAVSCWLMAYRRRPKTTGPLPHPPEFPNPLFTTPEPMAEPSPDYLT